MNKTHSSVVRRIELDPHDIAFYQAEGYLLLPGLIAPEDVEALYGEVVSIIETIGLAQTKLKQTKQYLAGSSLDALVNSPDALHLAAQLMGGPSRLHSPFTAVKGRNSGPFHLHQDNQYTEFDGPGINLWFALMDMTPENGCLQIEPRSHRAGTIEPVESPDHDGHRTVPYEPDVLLPVRMRAGDCVAFSRLTVHGSGANTTDAVRVAYGIQCNRNDVRARRSGQDEWLLLKDHPVIDTGPVTEIVAPTEPNFDANRFNDAKKD
jgi:2-oxoglutarate-dependent dioxygenase